MLLSSLGVAGALAAAAGADASPSSLPTLTQLRVAIDHAAAQVRLPTPTIPVLGQAIDGPTAAEYRGQTGCGDQNPGGNRNVVKEVACTFGDRTSRRLVLVTGDSEADMWVPTLDAWGRFEHWRIVRLVAFGCVPWAESPPVASCRTFDAMVARWVRKHRPQIVFPVGLLTSLQGGWENVSGGQMAREIEGMTRAWQHSGARVLVPQNIPWFYNYSFPQQCLATYPQDVRRCNRDPRSSVVSSGMREGMVLAATAGAIEVVPTEQLFCAPESCPVLVGSRIVYADQHHFARTWGTHIERAFATVFDPLVGPRSGG